MTIDAMVCGGTGMLAPATRHVARHVDRLTLIARRPEPLAVELGAHPIALDWSSSSAVDAIADSQPDLLISWVHGDGEWLLPKLEGCLPPHGRSIRVHGSAVAKDLLQLKQQDPCERSDIARQHVILGWMPGRWLTNQEISDAVIQAFEHPTRELVIAGMIEGNRP